MRHVVDEIVLDLADFFLAQQCIDSNIECGDDHERKENGANDHPAHFTGDLFPVGHYHGHDLFGNKFFDFSSYESRFTLDVMANSYFTFFSPCCSKALWSFSATSNSVNFWAMVGGFINSIWNCSEGQLNPGCVR